VRTAVALIGAAGKMGTRLVGNLRGRPVWGLLCADEGEAGLGRLRAAGIQSVSAKEAVARADVVVLAVPDARLAHVTRELVPLARPGTTFVTLDPAAAVAGEMTLRDDAHFVVCHPCHPPLFGGQPSDAARRDLFGGIAATQDLVMALLQGSEEAFARAEELCRAAFRPVNHVFRITVEQMAILEPAMAEVVAASAAVLIGEALEEAIRAGVPRAAATAFMLGHVQIPLAIVFGAIDSPFSDAARVAVAYGQREIYQPDWRKVFQPERIREVVHLMLHPEEQA